MGNEIARAQKPGEGGEKRYKPLFGKYPVCNVDVVGGKAWVHIGEGKVLAVAQLIREENKGHFTANLANNGTLGFFKELYKDAKDYFRKKGVDVDRFVDEAKKRRAARFLLTTSMLGWQKKKPITPEEEMEMTRRMCIAVDEYLRAHYPAIEEELVDCGYFGGFSRGSKIWTPKEGIYVAIEAPLTDNNLYSVNMQVNCNEKPELHEIIGLRERIKELLERKFPEYVEDILPNPPSAEFSINLGEIEKTKIETGLESLMID